MRSVLAFLLAAAPPGLALAHSLDGDVSLADQLQHQVAGAHHWPVLAATLLAVALVLDARQRRRERNPGPRSK